MVDFPDLVAHVERRRWRCCGDVNGGVEAHVDVVLIVCSMFYCLYVRLCSLPLFICFIVFDFGVRDLETNAISFQWLGQNDLLYWVRLS